MPEIQGSWCCGATSKESCETPPCPCNYDCWSPAELRELERQNRHARDLLHKAAVNEMATTQNAQEAR